MKIEKVSKKHFYSDMDWAIENWGELSEKAKEDFYRVIENINIEDYHTFLNRVQRSVEDLVELIRKNGV